MGYSTRNNGQIRTFWPDDTATKFYVPVSTRFDEIQARIKEEWPDAKPEEILFESAHIHTECLGYDYYDPMDYINFLVISYIKS